MAEVSLRGIIDMHVHSNPDIRRRAYDDFQLTEAAVREGARAIVLKSHQGMTAERAYLCNRYNEIRHNGDNDFQMFGSITLNRTVGGLNPAAVESGLRLGAKVVWLPTSSACSHLRKTGGDPEKGVACVKDGQTVPELDTVFQLVREYGAVLATGHLSPEECFPVVEAARDRGLKKIVITHPEWWVVGMSREDQVRIVKEYDVLLERCFAQNMGGGRYKSNLEENLEMIRLVGCEHVLISTDGGQIENPRWELAYRQYMQYLADRGVTEKELRCMTHELQARLLDLE